MIISSQYCAGLKIKERHCITTRFPTVGKRSPEAHGCRRRQWGHRAWGKQEGFGARAGHRQHMLPPLWDLNAACDGLPSLRACQHHYVYPMSKLHLGKSDANSTFGKEIHRNCSSLQLSDKMVNSFSYRARLPGREMAFKQK